MSINKLTADLNIIQTLDNQPSLTPEQLKAKFDEAVNIIKDYINNTLVDEVNSAISQLDNVGTLVDESIQDKLEDRYHVGSVIIDYTNTNPATYLGFGTWELCAVGKMFVGVNTNDSDFNTSGKTGGAKTVTLTTQNLPPHSHGVTDPGHSHYFGVMVEGDKEELVGPEGITRTRSFAKTTKNTTGITIKNTGGGQAVDKMPPYETVYKFRRVS